MGKMLNPLIGIMAIAFTIWYVRFFFTELPPKPLFVATPAEASDQRTIVALPTANTQAINIKTPSPNTVIQNPLIIRGEARGMWFFEGVFPIRLVDETGREIARGQAHALSEWTTDVFVPFQATLNYQKPVGTTGTILFEKDNPSGLPQNAVLFRIPVRFQ